MRNHFTPTRMAMIKNNNKKTNRRGADKDVEKMKCPYTADANVK